MWVIELGVRCLCNVVFVLIFVDVLLFVDCLFCCSVKNPTVKNNQGGPRKCTSEALRRQLSSGLGAGGVVYDDDTCRVWFVTLWRT